MQSMETPGKAIMRIMRIEQWIRIMRLMETQW